MYWVDINLALKNGLKFYQTRSNAVILHETFPACYIPKVARMETGNVKHEKVYMSPRPPPKIPLKHDWKRELGSVQSNQPIPNPSRDRTGQPVVRTNRSGQTVVGTDTRTVQDGRKTSRSQEIDVSSFHEEAVSLDRTGNPLWKQVKSKHVHLKTVRIPVLKRHMRERGDSLLKQTQKMCQMVAKHVLLMKAQASTLEMKHFVREPVRPLSDHDKLSHEQTMLNEMNMDFRIPGLPHSAVRHAQSTSVRELIQKIENHPDRHAPLSYQR